MVVRYGMWRFCLEKFAATHGLGLGAGGHALHLQELTGKPSIDFGHSLWLDILWQFGFIGVGLWLWFVWRLVRSFRYYIRETRDPLLQPLLYATAGALVSFAVHASIDFHFKLNIPWIILGLATGIMCTIADSKANRGRLQDV